MSSAQDTFEEHALPGRIQTAPEDSTEAALLQLSEKSFFQRGVVIEVLNNPSLRDDDQLSLLTSPSGKEGLPKEAADKKVKVDDLINTKALASAPRDSIIVRLVSPPASDDAPGPRGRTNLQSVVCYPFFSSHLSLPIKVGEHVWVFFESGIQNDVPIEESSNLEAWWLTRIVGPAAVEDPNYSHYDRRYDATSDEQAATLKFYGEDADRAEPPQEVYEVIPSFFNGSEQETEENSFTLMFREEYKDYYDAWSAKDDFVIEPVPRFTKRPGDMVLHGSHNATIVLGTDRGWKHDVKPDPAKGAAEHESTVSNAHRSEDDGPLTEGLGAIDIVVGRGRLSGAPADFEDAEPETGTEPLVVKNSRETYETNKNPGVAEAQKENTPFGHFNNRAFAAEGDPHFVNDSSRIYLTMKSNPDDQFAVIPDNIPTAFATEPEAAEETAAAVIKSDEIRIIARKQGTDGQSEAEPGTTGEVNGSIRIIKEGALDDDAAAIYLLPDGTIQISGNVIYIGRTSDDAGKDAGDGEKGSEPYMRYSDFSAWADALIAAICTGFDMTAEKIAANANAMTTGAAAGTSGGFQISVGPNAGLGAAWTAMNTGAGAQIGTQGDDLNKKEIEKFKVDGGSSPDIGSIKSERVFGE